jgi:hypothetical protein
VKRTAIIAAILFLVQAIPLIGSAPAETYLLNVPSSLQASEINAPFKDVYDALNKILSRYHDDAYSRQPKTALPRLYPNVKSDLSNVDEEARWVRYYRLSIGDQEFTARVFRPQDDVRQARVIEELKARIEGQDIIVQILPDVVKNILKGREIKPAKVDPRSPADKSV